jgi:hypothetical protein
MFKKITRIKKGFLFFSIFIFLFSLSQTAIADGLVPCGIGVNSPCTLCHLIVGIWGIMEWSMTILITLSITAISIAGIIYIVSSGNPTLTKQAKDIVTTVLIGFALTLGAWLIVNTTLRIFSAKEKTSGQGDYNLGLESENWHTFSCSTISSSTGATTTGQGGVAAEPVATSFDCSNFKFQTGISAQCSDASEELKTLMICLKGKFGDKMTVNSISDSAGLQNCISNYAKPPCAHAKSSCHYGGVAGRNSQAVDLSNKTGLTINEVTTAVTECGLDPSKSIKNEATHFHISTGSCQRAY